MGLSCGTVGLLTARRARNMEQTGFPMTHSLGLLYCFLATIVVIAGDYFIKLSADRGGALVSGHFLLGGSLYALSAVGWYLTLQNISLSQMGVGFSVLTLLSLCALGVVAFDEQLRPRDYLGIALAIVALLLMHRS